MEILVGLLTFVTLYLLFWIYNIQKQIEYLQRFEQQSDELDKAIIARLEKYEAEHRSQG